MLNFEPIPRFKVAGTAPRVSFGWFSKLSFAESTAEPLVNETVSGVADEVGVEDAMARSSHGTSRTRRDPSTADNLRQRRCLADGCADKRVREARSTPRRDALTA